MDRSEHTMENLFRQLGLSDKANDMAIFVGSHYLTEDQKLIEADFWSPDQVTFLQEALEQDSDWAEVVDQLDVLLRQKTPGL